MDGGLAGIGATACRSAAGRGLRRQSWRRRAGGFRLSGLGYAGNGCEFPGRGAAINQICKTFDLSLKVYELALEKPTGDMTQEPALDEKSCAATMAFGMEALASEPDLLVLGEMGIGNTTAAAAIYHALYGGQAEDWVGRGTGVDDEGLRRKADAVRAAVARHKPYLDDPLQFLARLGGRETAAIAGAILAARLRRTPVLLDGFVVCSAAAVLLALDDSALDHCLAAHVSAERAHRHALKLLGKTALLDFGMRLGEGSGAALAVESSKPRSPATTAWRPSRKRASPGRKSLERWRGRAPNPQTHRVLDCGE